MNIDKLKELLGIDAPEADEKPGDAAPAPGLLHEEQRQQMASDIAVLEDEDRSLDQRLQREAEKTVQSAAEQSLRRLHVVRLGRCPECGNHLSRHLFASVCESCGWNEYEVPRQGPVRVHLSGRPEPIEGDRCYFVKPDFVLVVRREVVVARVRAGAVDWIEYPWTPGEIEQRHRQAVQQMKLLCSWCEKECDPDRDGFHLAQVAFGSTQERHTFCSDECYEAFRRMYPARVHRNCYDRNCAECTLCVKRYPDDADGVRLLAKDYLRAKGAG
jgi:hypothetical protein